MLAHYIITINDLARMLKYHVLDRDLSKGRHLRRGTTHARTTSSALAWVQGLLHRAAYDQSLILIHVELEPWHIDDG